MLNVVTRLDEDSLDIRNQVVKCPYCGKMVVDVRYVSGMAMLRIKCTRCKHYINVTITEREV